ncbi:hypothetical protein JZ751_015569 [Albula glossodonta]|uniref:Uncharacterized protein n=1 Tax=Albula glossodonta TaxID=121402 RepID=A0A8T2P211_9TELE|nr:hypothetical protein JZ751_015569 [Albula glossodonta]
MSPPRLTGALRSFSNVSKQDNFTAGDVYDLKSKRLRRQELFSREGLTWQKITQFFSQHLEKTEQHAAMEELKKILQAARQIGNRLVSLRTASTPLMVIGLEMNGSHLYLSVQLLGWG